MLRMIIIIWNDYNFESIIKVYTKKEWTQWLVYSPKSFILHMGRK